VTIPKLVDVDLVEVIERVAEESAEVNSMVMGVFVNNHGHVFQLAERQQVLLKLLYPWVSQAVLDVPGSVDGLWKVVKPAKENTKCEGVVVRIFGHLLEPHQASDPQFEEKRNVVEHARGFVGSERLVVDTSIWPVCFPSGLAHQHDPQVAIDILLQWHEIPYGDGSMCTRKCFET